MAYQHDPNQAPYGYGYPAPPGPPKKSNAPIIIVIIGVVLVLLAGGFAVLVLVPGTSSTTSEGATLTVRGKVTVNGDSSDFYIGDGIDCTTLGGYQDIKEGAQVVITDAAGTTVAVGALQQGKFENWVGCAFDFEVPGVPPGHQFYGVEVSHRGRLQYPASRLSEVLSMTLGP